MRSSNPLAWLFRDNLGITLGIVAVVCIVCAVQANRVHLEHWLDAQVDELQKLQSERQVTAADQLIDNLHRNESGKLQQPPLASQLETATQWLNEEHGRLTALQTLVTQLGQHARASFTNAPVEAIADELNQARTLKETVAPEFRAGVEASLHDFETQFEPMLAATQPKLQAEFLELIGKCETLAGDLDRHNLALPALREHAAQGRALLDRLARLANPPSEKLKLPAALTARLAPLEAKWTGLQTSLAQLDQADAALHAATTLDAYLTALQGYNGDEIQQLPSVQAAHAVHQPKETDLERLLLMPDNPAGWAAFLKHPEPVALPPSVAPAEQAAWINLRNDDNLRDIYKYMMPLGPAGVPVCYPPNHDGTLYTRGPVHDFKINSLGESGNVMFAAITYIPAADSTRATFASTYCGCEYYHSEVWGVEKLGGLSAESAWWTKIRTPDLTDAKGNHYTKSLLELLDGVRAGEISPLFRAYIQWRLLNILAVRPAAWGSAFVPPLVTEQKALAELGADELESGDWMVPAKVEKFQKPLAAFYAGLKGVSYAKQEIFLHTLIAGVHADGLDYDGYVAADGSLVLTTAGKSHTMLWGLAQDTQLPALLFQTVAGHADLQPVAKPMPFTPLVSCKRSLTDSLEAAAQAAGIADTNGDVRPPLPPLFQAGSHP